MNQINLLIPCTSRKIQNASLTMNIKEHISTSVEETLHKWEKSFSAHKNRVKARDLYLGPGFTNLRSLAEKHGLSLKILSAGFGLIDGETELPSYNATFAANENRVPTPKSQWWKAISESKLPSMSLQKTFSINQDDYFIIVVSNEYLHAIQDDLLETLRHFDNAQNQIAIISTSIPKALNDFAKCFVQCTRGVLEHSEAKSVGLGLSDMNITAIATHLFLQKLDLTKPNFSDTIYALNEEFAPLKPKLRPKRITQPVESIKNFIRTEIHNGASSETSALRKYRDNGYACSVKRFSEFYNQVKSEKGLS
ncbi:DUF6884 domain-containing protein [Vibrio owensii]|uniref:DUF6884 domain-containing protein n=1 Tax=Vibrio owensii TaxID=696485 RepID=UPI0018F12491|nr:DUF6884 domain-containing protein [Vibrio owensii]